MMADQGVGEAGNMNEPDVEKARQWAKDRYNLIDATKVYMPQAQYYRDLAAYRAEGEREAERAAVEKARKAVCEGCRLEQVYQEDGYHERPPMQYGRHKCKASPIRAAFPHLQSEAKGEKL